MKVHSIKLECCVSGIKETGYEFNQDDVKGELLFQINNKFNTITLWLNERKMGYVSKNDTAAMLSILKSFPKYRKVIAWGIITQKEHYLMIRMRIVASDTFKFFVYQLSLGDGNTYIGSSNNFGARLEQHRIQLKTQKHPNKKMQNVYNERGTLGCQILSTGHATSPRYQFKQEQEWIDKLNPTINIKKAFVDDETLNEDFDEKFDEFDINKCYNVNCTNNDITDKTLKQTVGKILVEIIDGVIDKLDERDINS